ncbi:hypothetical protein HYS91_00685 [Candidatus Daviesbacteria bacterium]|nr:hypothetical protein [Candidatus Daviesbacteria bacterium]
MSSALKESDTLSVKEKRVPYLTVVDEELEESHKKIDQQAREATSEIHNSRPPATQEVVETSSQYDGETSVGAQESEGPIDIVKGHLEVLGSVASDPIDKLTKSGDPTHTDKTGANKPFLTLLKGKMYKRHPGSKVVLVDPNKLKSQGQRGAA